MIRVADFEVIALSNPTELPYGITMLGAPLEWSETKGKGIKVAVLDTGKPQHQDLEVVAADKSARFKGDLYDRNGHSTHVCGTVCANGQIKGVIPEASLYTFKVLDDDGHGDEDTVIEGIEWAVDKKVNVINMSLGSSSNMSSVLKAIQEAVKAGVKVVCAAGNEGKQGMSYPGKYAETVAVAAVDIDKEHANFSSIGKEVEVAAAGVQVLSTWLNGGYATLSGTSMGCPHIAGAVGMLDAKAQIRYGRKLSLEESRLLLHIYSEDVGKFGRDVENGFGVFSFGRLEQSELPYHEVVVELGKTEYSVDGIKKQMDVAPYLKNNRTMVPLRFMSEAFGKYVEPKLPKIHIWG